MDMTPKYIILNLVQGTISFVKVQLEANILESRETNQDKMDLLEINEGEKSKLNQLITMEASVKKAIELVKNVSVFIQ